MMHRHDEKWVKDEIMKLPDAEIKHKAWAGYKDAYQKAHDFEQITHKKENRARLEANTRLRKFVKLVIK